MLRTLFIFLILYLFAGCSSIQKNPWEPKQYPEKSKITVLKRIQNPNEGRATICGFAQNIDDKIWAIGSTVQTGAGKGASVNLDGYFSFKVEPGQVEVLAQNVGFKRVTKNLNLAKGETVILFIEFTPSGVELLFD